MMTHDRITIPDDLWHTIHQLIATADPHDPDYRYRALATRLLGIRNTRRVDTRGVVAAILYRDMTHCRWADLPDDYPDRFSVYRIYCHWRAIGLLMPILTAIADYLHARGFKSAVPAIPRLLAHGSTVCRNGHRYTPETTRYDKHGTRICRACARDHIRAFRQRHPEPAEAIRARVRRYRERHRAVLTA